MIGWIQLWSFMFIRTKWTNFHSWALLTNLSPMCIEFHNLGSSHNEICNNYWSLGIVLHTCKVFQFKLWLYILAKWCWTCSPLVKSPLLSDTQWIVWNGLRIALGGACPLTPLDGCVLCAQLPLNSLRLAWPFQFCFLRLYAAHPCECRAWCFWGNECCPYWDAAKNSY